MRGRCSLVGLLAKDGSACVHEDAARMLATVAGDAQKQDVAGICGGGGTDLVCWARMRLLSGSA